MYYVVLACMYYVKILQQILSESVSQALVLTGGQEAQGTAKFVSVIDKLWYCQCQ